MTEVITFLFFDRSIVYLIVYRPATFKRFNANYQYPMPVVDPIAVNPIQQHYDDPSMYNLPPPIPPAQMVPVPGQYANGTLVRSQNADGESAYDTFDWTDENFMLTSTVVYGFSLSDKLWCTSPTTFSIYLCNIGLHNFPSGI